MYITSPMENFNKNNPFIIIAKKIYDNIVDEVQLFGKNMIKLFIINGFIWFIDMIETCFYLYHKSFNIWKFSLQCIFLAVLYILLVQVLKKIKYFLSIHKSMIEFDRLSSLQVNDILALNNEDILKCINGLYELHGELTATIKYYRISMIIIMVSQILLQLSLTFIQLT